MRLLLVLLLLPILTSAQVQVSGAMRKIMQQADLSASIDIDTLKKDHLYALGVANGLKGEIVIIDGRALRTSVSNNKLLTQPADKSQAAMLVYAKVDSWRSVSKPIEINNLQELEKYLGTVTGKSAKEPFAFLIKSKKGIVNYHVIDWQPGTQHTMSNHKQFAKTGEATNQEVTILGFYSDHHQGVFTHHDTRIHLHLLTKESKIVGHIDKLQLLQYDLYLSN